MAADGAPGVGAGNGAACGYAPDCSGGWGATRPVTKLAGTGMVTAPDMAKHKDDKNNCGDNEMAADGVPGAKSEGHRRHTAHYAHVTPQTCSRTDTRDRLDRWTAPPSAQPPTQLQNWVEKRPWHAPRGW